jgi:LysM repeat protein
MTRETKIGLLVGLAFIIVVGILLSEHLTTTTERPAAPLAEAGKTVQSGISAPGVSTTYEPPVTRAPEPHSPVPTASELTPPPAGSTRVAVVGPAAEGPIIISDHHTPAANPGVAPASGDPVITRLPAPPAPAATNDPFANDPLVQAARARGEQIVPAGNGRTDTATSTPPKPSDTVAAATNAREYKAQAGDTLSRIAALLPGGNTKANREAVVKMNPSLQKDPNKIISGRTYLLPTQSGAPAPVTPPAVERASVVEAPKPADKPAPVAEKKPETKPESKPAETRTYVVQKGDTLTRIATEQLGSAREVATIRELNKDLLAGGDTIKVDMKLQLPAKSVASSN